MTPPRAKSGTVRPHNPGRVSYWDARNDGFRIRAVSPAARRTVEDIVRESTAAGVTFRYHNASGWWGDQGTTSQCTAYASLHYRHDGPVTPTRREPRPAVTPAEHYRAIQAIDRAAGRDYGHDGGATSLAMAKAMTARGWCGEYRWGTTLAELVAALLVEPVLLGVNWYEAMFDVDARGYIKIGGTLVGGHEIEANGINLPLRRIRLKNSWGRTWGRSGFCYLSFDDAERLIEEAGDVLLTRELPGGIP